MTVRIDAALKKLRETVRAGALNRPGVYRMLAETGIVIYVGKSKRLRTRLMGYFRARAEEKGFRIIREARRVEWEYVPSEFASLLLELELIKKYRPPYNVHQKRDGLYSFLKLSGGGAPRLSVVRRIADEPASYFGLRGATESMIYQSVWRPGGASGWAPNASAAVPAPRTAAPPRAAAPACPPP